MRITQLRWIMLLFVFPLFVRCANHSDEMAAEQMAAERTPVIQHSTPGEVSIFGGTSLVIEGELFDKSAQVSFGDVPAQQVEWISGNSIRVVSPPLMGKVGPVSLKVTNRMEDQPYSATRDDLLVAAVPELKLGTPVTRNIKSPSAIRTISLLPGLDGLLVFSQDDNKMHLLVYDAVKKGLQDQSLSVDFGTDAFSSLVVGDVTGDQLDDVLISTAAGRVITLLNNGLGGLAKPAEYATSIKELVLHAVGKFDAGDSLDVLYSADKAVGVLLNQSGMGWKSSRTTTLGAAPTHMHFVDVNQDGLLDAVFAQGGSLYVMQGVRSVALQIPYSVATGMQADTLVVDASGQTPHFVISGYHAPSSNYQWAAGTISAGNWQEVTSMALDEQSLMMEQGDLNGDGLQDVLLVPFSAGVQVWLGDADHTMQPGPVLKKPEVIESMQVFDVDGDHKPDLVIIQQTATGTQLVVVPNQSI